MSLWTSLPGETPLDDLSGLKIKEIRTRRELNFLEADNIRKAFVKYLAKKPNRRSAPFDLMWALRLHKQMFGDVWKWAGKPRKSDKNIGVPWIHVETSLSSLLDDLAYWEKHQTMDLLNQAVALHHRAVSIHPFENGNGRWSRLLANIWLKLHDQATTDWPETRVGQQSTIRNEYLNAIRLADRGEYEPLRTIHLRFTSPA